MEKNKTGKYLKYAIGEIVLVVIGILIALQINNWNTNNSEIKKIKNYYTKIADEINFVKENVKDFQNSIDTLIILNKKSIYILNLKNKDSLTHLKKSIGSLGTAYLGNFTFPMLEEFLEQDLLSKIKNDSLKYAFTAFKIADKEVKYMDSYIQNQYSTSIEPYFYKNINYANVAFRNNDNTLIKGGPKTDYSTFLNNLELYNLLTFKLESLNAQKYRLDFLERTLIYIEEKIEEELNSR